MTPGKPVCLIGGTGRSGTTLLSRIFSHHPDAAWVSESRYLVDPDGLMDYLFGNERRTLFGEEVALRRLRALLRRSSHKSGPGRVLSAVSRRPPFDQSSRKLRMPYGAIATSSHVPRFDQLSDELLSTLSANQWEGDWEGMPIAADRVMVRALPQSEKLDAVATFLASVVADACGDRSHYIEKNTWNILWFDRIRQVMPGARLVHIVRHPLDVVSSYSRQSWAPTDPLESAHVVADLHQRWSEVLDAVDPEAVHEVRLEDLVEAPEGVLTSICNFWDLPFRTQLLDEPLSSGSVGRWRTDKRLEGRSDVASILSPVAQRYGYEL